MTASRPEWLEVREGAAPLIISFPHTGDTLPPVIQGRLVSSWLAKRDADWWIDRLYDFAHALGATTVRTAIGRTVIDVNRDPSGASLYPGLATTELCPTTTFDGDLLYPAGLEPEADEIARRRAAYFEPYHEALSGQIARLRSSHARVILYDAHAIRSRIPRLFDGQLPQFNIGTNDGKSCDPRLAADVAAICASSGRSWVMNGRFKGGWTTRCYGAPDLGVHTLQMELACRGYMHEPDGSPTPENWPPPYDGACAAPLREVLIQILTACLSFARRCAPDLKSERDS